MRDPYAREYTELRNAPHFIFDGIHTRDLNVSNVQTDSGLAKDTFLANRTLTEERTRYSDKSYLLGYTEEPLKFKVRLLFDEHKFNYNNIRTLKRWIDTPTYREFRFDNQEESALNIVVYAMITGTSELTHNVIDDGYLDLEFSTNSSKKYSEIMEDNYDFTKNPSETIAKKINTGLKKTVGLIEELSRKLKQYIANTNYANIEEAFEDNNFDKLPDGWKLISGSENDITIADGKMSFNNVHLRKRFNPINGRNYYLRVNGQNGKVRVHENDYDINTLGVHQFKYRKNLLGDAGTFDIDSSGDGIGEGWTKAPVNPNMIKTTLNKLGYFTQNSAGKGTSSLEGEWIKITPAASDTVSVYTPAVNQANLTETYEVGAKYTFSATVKVPANNIFIYYVSASDFTTKSIPASTTEKTHYITMTFTKTTANQFPVLVIGQVDASLYVKDVKLEKGDTATFEGTYSIDKTNEWQNISMFGKLQYRPTLLSGMKYVLIAKTPTLRSKIKVNGVVYDDTIGRVIRVIPFESNGDNLIEISSNDTTIRYQHMRIYQITETEYTDLIKLTENPNLAHRYDFITLNNNTYQTIEKLPTKYTTGEDIYKVTKNSSSAHPPNNMRVDRIKVPHAKAITASMYFKHESTNINDHTTSIGLYNYQEAKMEAQTSIVKLTPEWSRIAITFNNTSGYEKEVMPLFYVAKGLNNVTYFTSPQIEINTTSTEFKTPIEVKANELYPHFDNHSYFDIDYTGATGYINYIDLWELDNLDKAKLDSGVPIEEIVYFDYQSYLKMLSPYESQFKTYQEEVIQEFNSLLPVTGINPEEYRNRANEDFYELLAILPILVREDNMKVFQWADIQPEFLALKNTQQNILEFVDEINKWLADSASIIDKAGVGSDLITVYNFGDRPVYPTFEFVMSDTSDIKIVNEDTGEQTIITDNLKGEVIKLIGASEKITTSRLAPYFKYDSHDDVFIRLKLGYNNLRFYGNYTVKITYQFVLL